MNKSLIILPVSGLLFNTALAQQKPDNRPDVLFIVMDGNTHLSGMNVTGL